MNAPNHAQKKICPNDLLLSSRSINDIYGVPEPACVSKYTASSMFDVLHLEISSNCPIRAGSWVYLPIANTYKTKVASTYAQKKKVLKNCPNALFLSSRSLKDELGSPEPVCDRKYFAPYIFVALDLEILPTVNHAMPLPSLGQIL